VDIGRHIIDDSNSLLDEIDLVAPNVIERRVGRVNVTSWSCQLISLKFEPMKTHLGTLYLELLLRMTVNKCVI
jgi:hypothetical protein